MKLTTRDMILVSMFAALMVVGAFLKIPNPINPSVPITFQLFFSVLAGVFLGAYKGALSQLIYLFLGLVGVPVFTEGGGLGYVFNAKFGFILGFVLCALVVGLVTKWLKSNKVGNYLLAGSLGLIAIYVIGIVYMTMILNVVQGAEVPLSVVIGWMIPFVIKDEILVLLIAIASVQVVPRVAYVKN